MRSWNRLLARSFRGVDLSALALHPTLQPDGLGENVTAPCSLRCEDLFRCSSKLAMLRS
jgi:hypothetical protein